jgi:hypothetical protein
MIFQRTIDVLIELKFSQRTEVSIHVTLINRHSLLDVDGESSTPDDPNIVCEHFYVISRDDNCYVLVFGKILNYIL